MRIVLVLDLELMLAVQHTQQPLNVESLQCRGCAYSYAILVSPPLARTNIRLRRAKKVV